MGTSTVSDSWEAWQGAVAQCGMCMSLSHVVTGLDPRSQTPEVQRSE